MLLANNRKTSLISFIIGSLLMSLFSVLIMSPVASAQQSPEECRARYGSQPDRVERCITGETATAPRGNCEEGYVETSFAFGGKKCLPENEDSASVNQNPIFILFTEFLKFFSALVGVAVAGGVIWGGILYSTAQGSPGQIQKAITVITNSILGLIMYILMFAIINFLVPGGLFA